jgi:N-glycosylase/DNA lyase
MQNLIAAIENLKRGELRKIVDSRICEFKKAGSGTCDDIFRELCFCLLTANYSAAGGIRIQQAIGDGFATIEKAELERRLKELGHRFPHARAGYICEARKHKASLKDMITSYKSESDLREWVVKHVKGLGYKEASHFLRNIGFENLAIIDFHIIDILERYRLIKRPKTLTRNRYLETEQVLMELAKKLGITLAELDLYLWYMETGKVLK